MITSIWETIHTLRFGSGISRHLSFHHRTNPNIELACARWKMSIRTHEIDGRSSTTFWLYGSLLLPREPRCRYDEGLISLCIKAQKSLQHL